MSHSQLHGVTVHLVVCTWCACNSQSHQYIIYIAEKFEFLQTSDLQCVYIMYCKLNVLNYIRGWSRKERRENSEESSNEVLGVLYSTISELKHLKFSHMLGSVQDSN